MLPALELLVAAKRGAQEEKSSLGGETAAARQSPDWLALPDDGGIQGNGDSERSPQRSLEGAPLLAKEAQEDDSSSVLSQANNSVDSITLFGNDVATELQIFRKLSPTSGIAAHGSPEHLTSGVAIGSELELNIKSLKPTTWSVDGSLRFHPQQQAKMRSIHWDEASAAAIEKDVAPAVPKIVIKPRVSPRWVI